MKKKIFLVILVIILTITNFILFRNVYNKKTSIVNALLNIYKTDQLLI